MESTSIWKSPGLERALETVEGECRDLVFSVLKPISEKYEVFTISPEEIIRKVLLNHFKLTEKDLEEYELRPKGMVRGGLFTPTPTGGKGKICEQFLKQFEVSKNSFKSLADNALLKSWEFTLASFSETKAQFTRWNLYTSLGLKPQEKGGIGQCLFEILQRKLNECNTKVKEHQEEYEYLHTQVQFLQRRIQRASTEQEAQWTRAEYRSRVNEFNLQEELRNKFHNKARRYANLFDGLIDLYDRLFPKYFQEVYDADIHQVAIGPYDDSPAGFRLIYKHGRSNTSQWTKIQNHIEFIDSLANFFSATESEVAGSPEMSGLEDDITEITTAVVTHVRSKEFLETAFHRMAITHNVRPIKDPLDHLDKIEKKPWVYTSGGALTTLVSCYFRREEKPTEMSRWVENPMELLTFFADSVKEIPDYTLDEFEKNPEKSVIVHSPTHAFLLKPGYSPFKEAWKTKKYTYTWVRDNLVKPMERFCELIYLDEDKMQLIIEELRKKVPENFKPYFKDVFGGLRGSLSARDFRQHIVDTMDITMGLKFRQQPVLSREEIDSTLYNLLPIIPSYKLEEQVEKILEKLPEVDKQILPILSEITGKIGAPKLITSKGLREIIQSLIALSKVNNTAPFNYPKLISRAAQELGFAMPTPIIFSDTNWVKDYFAFVVNPGTTDLELWRMDDTGSVGSPMTIWTEWLNGSRKDLEWGVYTQPHEYKL